jgi:tRNA A-37 threonylcarbamoyl transferase component Bud32
MKGPTMTEPEPTEPMDRPLDALLVAVLRQEDDTEVIDPVRLPELNGAEAAAIAAADPQAVAARVSQPPAPAGTTQGATGPQVPAGAAGTPSGQPTVPGYEILGRLGQGGMGVVWKARQVKADRVVALKMIKADAHTNPDTAARFRTEAEAVARLRHPGIVQIYEVGEHEGKPFFSLEYCPGGSLEEKLNGTPLLPRDAASLIEQLARAMSAAHQANVVHRDLKPANVLLASAACGLAPGADVQSAKPQAAEVVHKITDFGLAKKLDNVAGPTVTGAIVGTPSYMAPEQVSGKKEVGPAADVYGLGAILYECLTGRPPFKAATLMDTYQQVLADDPVPPTQLQPRTPRDLETICLKCLQKEPGRRYATAADLAADLHRFRTGEPIMARPVGVAERTVKWVKRRPSAAALLGVSVLGALLLLLGGAYFTRELARERNTARDEKATAEGEWKRAEDEKEKGDKERRRAEQEEAEARRQLERARANLMTAQLLRVDALWERDPGRARELLHDYNACPIDLRDFAWNLYDRVCKRDRLTLVGHAGGVLSVAFSPDGKALASGSQDRTIKLWDAASGQERATLKGHTDAVLSVAFSADGKALASASRDNTIKLWDAASGQERATLQGHTDTVTSVAFSADGKALASGSLDGTVKVWDVASGQERDTLKGHAGTVTSVAFSADGKALASGSEDSTVKLWDAASGQQRATLKGHAGWVWSVAFSADGKALASGSQDGTVKLWDAASGQQRSTIH